jgi:hypothetical protein
VINQPTSQPTTQPPNQPVSEESRNSTESHGKYGYCEVAGFGAEEALEKQTSAVVSGLESGNDSVFSINDMERIDGSD